MCLMYLMYLMCLMCMTQNRPYNQRLLERRRPIPFRESQS